MLASPYNWRESLGWVWRNLVGPSRANDTGARFVASSSVFNEIEPRLRLAFLGDVMGLRGRRLVVDPAVRQFVADCDFLVANFEGTLTTARKSTPYDQVHEPRILDALAALFPPEKTFLSVANNHAADFGEAAFRESVARLRERGFRVFGTATEPAVDPCPEARLVAWTCWSNRPAAFLSHGPAPDAGLFRPGACHLLFPHCGYELEWFPRRETAREYRQWLNSGEAAIGHHPHTPQPVASAHDTATGRQKLLAYSLGDFCFCGPRLDFYRWGLIVKMELGPTLAGAWAAGRVDWRFTRCLADVPGELRVTIGDAPPVPFDMEK